MITRQSKIKTNIMSDMNTTVAMPPVPQNGAEQLGADPLVAEDDQFTFSTVRHHLEAMHNEWNYYRDKAQENRKTRDVEVSVEVLRREGTLDEDETLVPVRIIDTNITRELPPYINYIKNSRRLCIFTCISNPDQATDKLEIEFTRGMTYPNWEKALYKKLDGSATHGWDSTKQPCPGRVPISSILYCRSCLLSVTS